MERLQLQKYISLLKSLYVKYEEIILYLFFGGLTTVINFSVYIIATDVLYINYLVSNALAFVFAVLFAFITNKIWVFKNRSFRIKRLIFEFVSFFGARILTLCMDMSIMYVFVDVYHMNDLIIKIISNVLVVIANYVMSKFFIFAKRK